MRLFLALLLSFSNPALASTSKVPLIFKTEMQSKVVAYENYEDFRIDSDRDGLVDLWVIKSGKTTVFVQFKNAKTSSMLFRYASSNSIREAQYDSQDNKWVLTYSTHRAPQVMNGTAGGLTCEEQNKTVLNDLAKFKDDLSSKQAALGAAEAIACDDEDNSADIETGLRELVTSDFITNCISGSELQSKLPGVDPSELLYYSNKMKLDLKKIAHQQDGKGLITCQEASADQTEPKGKFVENGKISISIPKNGNAKEIKSKIKPLLFHELLHRSGITDESITDQIVAVCSKDGVKAISHTAKNRSLIWNKKNVENASDKINVDKANISKEVKTAKAVPQTASRSIASEATAMETGAGTNSYNMAKEISSAEVQQSVPSASSLASNIGTADTNDQRSLESSQRQSAPVLAMADRAMGVMNTPALASDDSSTASGSSSTRSRDRYQARHEGYESDSASSKSADTTDYSKTIYKPSRSNGGTVVEEIDLTKGASTVNPEIASRTTSGNSRGIASASRTTGADVPAVPDEVAGRTANSGGSVSGGGSGTFYADSGTSSGRTTNANRRGIASQNAGSAVETSREEVITFIANANYAQTKSKLRDQSFQQTLSNNQISIIYADGSDPIGAKRGTTVFLDDGSRFVMQRRK